MTKPETTPKPSPTTPKSQPPDEIKPLETTLKRVPPNFREMAPDLQDDYRSYYRIQMEIIKRDYPKLECPQFDKATDLDGMHAAYEKCLDLIQKPAEKPAEKIYCIDAERFVGLPALMAAYDLTESQIEKLFLVGETGKYRCRMTPSLMQAFRKK